MQLRLKVSSAFVLAEDIIAEAEDDLEADIPAEKDAMRGCRLFQQSVTEGEDAVGLEHAALTWVAANGLCGIINGQRLRDFIDDQSKKPATDAQIGVRCDACHNVPEKAAERKAEEYHQKYFETVA